MPKVRQTFLFFNSVGLELDTIGEILGSKRNARSDNDYRLELKLYSKLNNAKGTPNFFIFAFNSLTRTNQRFYTEKNANIIMYVNFSTMPNDAIISILAECVTAGVGLIIFYTINEEIFISKMQSYQLFANGEQVTADNNDVYVSFGEQSQTKRFTQGLYGNGELLFADGVPIGVDYFDSIVA